MSGVSVVDASALIDAVLPTRRRSAVLEAFAGNELWAPQIIELEVISALARLERSGQISTPEADRALGDVRVAPIALLDGEPLVPVAWASRRSIRISDGFYVAAARLLDAPLLTCDGRLARAPLSGVTVTVIR